MGAMFEKTSLKEIVILHSYLSDKGLKLAKLPELFDGNKLDNCVQHARVL